MGGGTSTAKNIAEPTSKTTICKIFTDEIIIDGCSLLREDELFASSFIDYLKSGAWLDRLKSYPCGETSSTAENETAPIYTQYNISISQMTVLEKNNWLGTSTEGGLSPSRGSSRSHRSNIWTTSECGEKYIASEDCSCFNDTQLCNILLSVVYPMYMASSYHERFLRFGPEGSRHVESDSCSECTGTNIIAISNENNPSRRVPLILLNTAMHYDGTELLERLKTEIWVEQLSVAIDDHCLAVSVVNTTIPSHPFIYINRAFEKVFGLTEAAVLGKSMSIIDSPFTERTQQVLLQDALRRETCTKLAITHKTSAKIPFLDLLAVRAVGAYTVCVHFPAKRGSNFHHLKVEIQYIVCMYVQQYMYSISMYVKYIYVLHI